MGVPLGDLDQDGRDVLDLQPRVLRRNGGEADWGRIEREGGDVPQNQPSTASSDQNSGIQRVGWRCNNGPKKCCTATLHLKKDGTYVCLPGVCLVGRPSFSALGGLQYAHSCTFQDAFAYKQSGGKCVN